MSNLPTTLSENLPTNIEDYTDEMLLALAGLGQGTGSSLPSLRVNYDDEDDDGNEIPRGQWVIWSDGGPVFSKEVQFRILYQAMQYSHYDVDEGKQISKSVFFRGFDEEIYDSIGTEKCGRVTKKVFETLTKAEQKDQKKRKLARVCFGTVSMTGVDKRGEAATIENLPCVFYARGTNFMPITEALNDMEKQKVVPQRVTMLLSLLRHKNDGVTYWQVVPSYDGENTKLVEEDLALIDAFHKTVVAESEEVYEAWRKANIKNGAGSADISVDLDAASEDLDPAAQVLNDDIPL